MRVAGKVVPSGVALALVLSLALWGCGGGGGATSTPAPLPSPTPTPTPTSTPTPTPIATPTPAAEFNTREYRFSDGAAFHQAIPAWQTGATGKGVSIAIVDTGIDVDNAEFAGRISPSSTDVAGARGIDDVGGHGTMVALVAAAARDDYGVLGIAWGATIMAMRADDPGSCQNSSQSCVFYDDAIARGVDRAVAAGARIINLSLGGAPPDQVVRDAVSRAGAAGVLVVVAAGNDADDPLPAFDPTQPDPFAIGLRQSGNGNVIIAGSVKDDRTMSSFSNPAGNQAQWYLTALGDRVCCVYVNGQLKTTVDAQGNEFVYLSSGTSFAAPQIAGAAALLFQAFPNLTGQQVADLLLRSADDLGEVGTDAIFGRGVLNIARAFAPQGATALAGSTARIALADTSVAASPAMGDALSGQGLQATVLDSFGRAYRVDFGLRFRAATARPVLAPALAAPTRGYAAGGDGLSLAYSLDRRGEAVSLPWSGHLRLGLADARRAEVLAARVAARIAPGAHFAVGYRQGADGLVAQVQGAAGPAFLVAPDPAGDFGFARTGELAFALRQALGRWGLTASAERGDALSGSLIADAQRLAGQRERASFARFGLALDRDWGDIDTALGLGLLDERRTVLGARLHPACGGNGARTLLLDARAGWSLAPGWRIGAAWREGRTQARGTGLVADGSRLSSNGWAFDVARSSVFFDGDSLAFRVAQPLRVRSGGLAFDLPVAWNYDTLAATPGVRRLSLAPHGHEVSSELAWRGALWGGAANASLFWRRQPDNRAASRDDRGVALGWKTGF